MNIELACSNCQSVLSVARLHAGKQLRCPTCGEINLIPEGNFGHSDSQDDIPAIAPIEETLSYDRGNPNSNYEAPPYRGPQSAPVDPSRPWPASGGTTGRPHHLNSSNEKALGKSYLMFGLGVLSYILCGCLGVVIAPMLFGSGMSSASKVSGEGKAVAYGLNLFGFIGSLLIIGIVILIKVVSAM